MGGIKGIRLDLTVGSQSWAGSDDKLFLGMHGEAGGREFRLDGNMVVGGPLSEHKLALGSICCDAPGYQQGQYSTALGDNDPMLAPIELSSIQYVYLRKETADSTATNDDVLSLAGIAVLLCDDKGALRRFKKTGKLNFSDETGLQHWLTEADPPYCEVKIVLKRVTHEKADKHRAGNSWELAFSAGPVGNDTDIIHDHPRWARDSWEIAYDESATWKFPGCCGHPRTLFIYALAKEFDSFTNNDMAEWTREILAPCNTATPFTESAELALSVKGSGKRESLVTFEYDVISTCVD